jgi:hypothetical protein
MLTKAIAYAISTQCLLWGLLVSGLLSLRAKDLPLAANLST